MANNFCGLLYGCELLDRGLGDAIETTLAAYSARSFDPSFHRCDQSILSIHSPKLDKLVARLDCAPIVQG